MTMEAVIQISKASKCYAKKKVFENLNLQIIQGDCFALTGENGAGKSTLIKCILDFIELDQGAITVCKQPNTAPLSRLGIAYLPERFTPPYYLTGKSFLNYAADLWQVRIEKKAIDHTFNALDLDPSALSRSVKSLSKGMTQKLGLAACFLSRKPLLLLDEPMSGLDPKARVQVKEMISSLKQENRSVLFTSHLLADVDDMASRIAILHQGRVVYDGTPQACRNKHHAKSLEQAYIHCIETQRPDELTND